MKGEKIYFIITIFIISILLVFAGISYFGFRRLEHTIKSSQSDLDRIIELESRISEYDESITELELRESGIRKRELEIEIREGTINLRLSEIAISERDLVIRKSELERREQDKLRELESKITESRKLVELIKSRYTSSDNSIDTGDN